MDLTPNIRWEKIEASPMEVNHNSRNRCSIASFDERGNTSFFEPIAIIVISSEV